LLSSILEAKVTLEQEETQVMSRIATKRSYHRTDRGAVIIDMDDSEEDEPEMAAEGSRKRQQLMATEGALQEKPTVNPQVDYHRSMYG